MAKAPHTEQIQQLGIAPAHAAQSRLLEEMRNSPVKNWTIKNVETLCNQLGLVLKAPRRGSHYKVRSAHLEGMITIPAKKPIKAPYIKALVSMADAHLLAVATQSVVVASNPAINGSSQTTKREE
jgi:hypothetical protein